MYECYYNRILKGGWWFPYSSLFGSPIFPAGILRVFQEHPLLLKNPIRNCSSCLLCQIEQWPKTLVGDWLFDIGNEKPYIILQDMLDLLPPPSISSGIREGFFFPLGSENLKVVILLVTGMLGGVRAVIFKRYMIKSCKILCDNSHEIVHGNFKGTPPPPMPPATP